MLKGKTVPNRTSRRPNHLKRDSRFSIKKTNKPRQLRNWRGLMKKNPGGDLLLRDLSSDYHWRGSVSLPGSERDRVGPLRSGHRASGGRGLFFSSSCLPGSPWGALRGIFLGLLCVWLRRFPLVTRGRNQRKLTSAWLVVLLLNIHPMNKTTASCYSRTGVM